MPQPVHWEPHILEATLRSAGFAPVPVGLRVPDAFPSVLAIGYRVGAAEVNAFFFGDPVAAVRAARRLTLPRDGETSAFTSNNMVVMVRTNRRALREEIRRALTVPEAEGAVSR